MNMDDVDDCCIEFMPAVMSKSKRTKMFLSLLLAFKEVGMIFKEGPEILVLSKWRVALGGYDYTFM